MAHVKAGVAALAVAVFACGCASVEAPNATLASTPEAKEEQGYITGSRLPRKASQNTQGTQSAGPQEWYRYQPPAGLKSD